MQSSPEALISQLCSSPSPVALEAVLALAKEHHGALPISSFAPLLRALTLCLRDLDTAHLATQVCAQLIPESGVELEAGFGSVLAALSDRLASDYSDLVSSTLLQYASHTKNLDQVLTALFQNGLQSAKVSTSQWQGRLRALSLVEPLLQVDPHYLENAKTAQKVLETLIHMVKDSAFRVQIQAKTTVLAVAQLVPELPKILSSLSQKSAEIYENEVAVRAQRNVQALRFLRSSLQSQPKPEEDTSSGFAYQTATTERCKPPTYESQTAPNGLEFGFVPLEVMTQLREAENWRTRANAVHELEALVISASDDVDTVSPFLGAFVRFLKDLLTDTNLKVTQSSLSIVTTLLTLPGLSKRANVAQLLPSCLDKLGDNKIAVRQAAFKVFRGFIEELPPRLLFPPLLSALGSSNWHIREAVLHVMMAAMLGDNPDYEYDFCALIHPVAELMDDPKPKVSFTASETLAVIANVKGSGTVLEALSDRVDEDRLERLRKRFEQGTLPTLRDDYIEFPKTQPTSAPLISATQPVFSPDEAHRSLSPLVVQKDVNSSNSTEDTSVSPGFRFGLATDAKKRDDCDLPALRQPYLPINMSTKAGGYGRRVSYGYQMRSSLSRRRPLLRFNLARQGADTASECFPSPIPTRRKAVEPVSASENSLYAPLETLDPVASPEEEFQQCLVASQATEWSVQFEMLNMLRRLLRHHVSVFYSNLHPVVLTVVKLADSLRSSLAKNSLIVIKELAENLGRDLDADLEVVCPLVTRKCGDTNVFISEEAELALLAICQHCSENRVIVALLGQSSTAKVSTVKAKISLGLQHVLRRCADNSVRVKDIDRLFVVLAGYLVDASADVRSGARAALSVLRLTYPSGSDFEKVLFRSLPDKTAREVKSGLDDSKPVLRPLRSQSSRRTASPFKSVQVQRRRIETSEEENELGQCAKGLNAAEWKTRYDTLDALSTYITTNSEHLRKSPQIMTVVDLLTQATGDKNLSVSLHALDGLRKAVPQLSGCLEPHLALLLRALSQSMASANSAIRDASVDSVRLLFAHSDTAYACSALCSSVPAANAKAKPTLVALVCDKYYR